MMRKMYEILNGLNGCRLIADDMLVIGKGETEHEATRDHDRNFHLLMQRAMVNGLKFNPDKIKLKLF